MGLAAQGEATVDVQEGGESKWDEEKEKQRLEAEFEKVYPQYKQLTRKTNWHQYAEIDGDSIDILEDLVDADMLAFYRTINEAEQKRVEAGQTKLYGLLPAIASCRLGALNSESFCERVISCANNVVSKMHTHLTPSKIAAIVFLRMNKDFIEYVRGRWGNEIEKELNRKKKK